MGVKPRSELLYKWASSARDLSRLDMKAPQKLKDYDLKAIDFHTTTQSGFQSGPEAGVSARYCIS